MSDRTRILLLIPRLRAGGAERVMTLIARRLSPEKYEVHLAMVMSSDSESIAMPESVTVHALGARRARTGAIPLLKLVWRVRPQVILSGAAEISFLALMLRPFFPAKTRVLVRQNGTASSVFDKADVPRYTRLLYRWLFRYADQVICQSRAMAEDLVQAIGIDRRKVVVLPNPIDLEGARVAAPSTGVWSGNGPHLLAVGRLSREKGFDLLIEALALVRARFADADLIIVGDGGEASQLNRLCHKLGLDGVVRFAGRVGPPYGFFAGATMFVLSSRYEGMPNALLEAAAAGLPLVATPASGGVVDLLRGRPGAWLASEISATALAHAMMAALKELTHGQRFAHAFVSTERGGEKQEAARENEIEIAALGFPK